jgi:hypothetical protein
MVEIWKDIPGIEGYQISSIGRIKSFARKSPTIHTSQYSAHRQNYVLIKGVRYDTRILMLTAFVGPPTRWDRFEYINGMVNDNRIQNLRWMNLKEKADEYHKNNPTTL